MYALMTAVGIFPKASNCIKVPKNNYKLEIQGGGGFKLILPFDGNKFSITPFTRNLTNSPPVRTYAEYADDQGNPTEITININSLASPSWSFRMSPVSVVLDYAPFDKLTRIVGNLEGHNGVKTKIVQEENKSPRIVFGSVLSPIQEIVTILRDLGLPSPITMDFGNAGSDNKKFKLGFQLKLKLLGKDGIEIGCGKLKAALGLAASFSVPTFNRLKGDVFFTTSLSGDLQTAVIPKLVYAGGFFKFEIGFAPADLGEIREKHESAIKLAVGLIGSVGSKELIPRVLGIEGEVKRGIFMKIIGGSIKPGLLVGGSVTVILLNIKKGALGISFELEAQGTLYRSPDNENKMILDATATIALSINLAFFLEIEIGYEAPFKEEFDARYVGALTAAVLLVPPAGGVMVPI
jgi:hypothetical protein